MHQAHTATKSAVVLGFFSLRFMLMLSKETLECITKFVLLLLLLLSSLSVVVFSLSLQKSERFSRILFNILCQAPSFVVNKKKKNDAKRRKKNADPKKLFFVSFQFPSSLLAIEMFFFARANTLLTCVFDERQRISSSRMIFQ